ncbi:hypothetical protein GU926_03380 [Nibribacter ruber]|uniref:DUF3108 domain-containing protein n=1 Tax=Nibribacter ruber TaxID=2698458 RepID=A0A6P1NZU5_9BACT|nr:hypothetical protein [Nibribacter ruber]QHL86533.1 hypothetical protein GU926_03380 [Nibribacter ruber]
MKRLILLLLLITFGVGQEAITVQAQTVNCAQPFGYAKNTEFIYQVTDKGRAKGTLHNMVIQQTSPEAGINQIEFKSARINHKKRPQTAEEFHIICKGDSVYLDAKLLLREQALKSFYGKEFDYIMKDIAYPSSLAVGQTLPSAGLDVRVRSSQVNLTRILMNTGLRQVVAQETIKTPAGTFDCFKITYQYTVSLDAMGLPMKDVFQVEEYFSPEHGLIKIQFYTKKGKKAKGLELISRRDRAS